MIDTRLPLDVDPARRCSRPGALRTALALIALLLIGLGPASAAAQSVDDEARGIGQTLQCPVCNGLSVADSPSQLAVQMRSIIKDKLAAGESDEQIRAYFVERYGESVLLIPPRSGFTLLAWITPYLALALAFGFLVTTVRRRRQSSATPEAQPPAVPDVSLDPYLEEVDRTYARVRDESLR